MPVQGKKFRPKVDIEVAGVTIHANPVAEALVPPPIVDSDIKLIGSAGPSIGPARRPAASVVAAPKHASASKPGAVLPAGLAASGSSDSGRKADGNEASATAKLQPSDSAAAKTSS